MRRSYKILTLRLELPLRLKFKLKIIMEKFLLQHSKSQQISTLNWKSILSDFSERSHKNSHESFKLCLQWQLLTCNILKFNFRFMLQPNESTIFLMINFANFSVLHKVIHLKFKWNLKTSGINL